MSDETEKKVVNNGDVIPRSNAPANMEPWVRAIEQRVGAMERSSAISRSMSRNAAARMVDVGSALARESQARQIELALALGDLEPTAAPSQPSLASRVTSVIATWDGKLWDGSVPPTGFSHVSAEYTATFPPSMPWPPVPDANGNNPGPPEETNSPWIPVAQTLSARGSLVIADVPVGEMIYVRFKAVTRAGHVSYPSQYQSVLVMGVEFPDIDATINDAIEKAQQDADYALTSANGKTTNYYQGTKPTGGTYVKGDTWFDTSDGNKIYDYNGTDFVAAFLGEGALGAGAVTTTKIADLAVTDAKISNINAGKITAGTIDAGRIGAKTITANMLVVADFANLADGSDFEDAALVPWDMSSSYLALSGVERHSGALSLRASPGPTTVTSYLNRRVPVTAGEQYYMELWAWRQSAFNGTTGNSKLRIGDQDGNAISAVPFGASSLPAGVWTKLSGSFAVPAGVTSLRINLVFDNTAGVIYLDDIQIRRMANSELIVDGAITTRTLAANSVTANELAADSVTANAIKAGAVTAGSLSATALNGQTITGSTIRTSASGKRVELSTSNYIRLYSTDGGLGGHIESLDGAGAGGSYVRIYGSLGTSSAVTIGPRELPGGGYSYLNAPVANFTELYVNGTAVGGGMIASGNAPRTASIAAGAGYTFTVTFPLGRFTATPSAVVATPGATSRLQTAITAKSATSCSIRVDNFTSAAAVPDGVEWIAVQG